MSLSEGLHVQLRGDEVEGRPVLVLMHSLGSSLREWDQVVDLLGSGYKTLALDLPGFGGSSAVSGYSVDEMADAVQAEILAASLTRYVLVAHGLSARVAAVLARRLADAGSKALKGLVLVAGSPPGAEPMEDARRQELLGLLSGEEQSDAGRARTFLSEQGLRDLSPAVADRAVNEMLRMNRAAWTAWVNQGSREDWRERVGLLTLPAVVVAGEKDVALGPERQRRETMPHIGNGRLVVFDDCFHLVPLEQPEPLADLLRAFVETVSGGVAASVLEEYGAFLKSSRVSQRTREVVEARMAGTQMAHTESEPRLSDVVRRKRPEAR